MAVHVSCVGLVDMELQVPAVDDRLARAGVDLTHVRWSGAAEQDTTVSDEGGHLESAGLMAPEERSRINRYIAAELLAWAATLDAAEGLYMVRSMRQQLAADLRSRAFELSPPNPDDMAEIEARLAKLRELR